MPKELITSEAIHEAVVKCFVAAGAKDARPDFGCYKDVQHFDCMYIADDMDIALGEIGLFAKKPLTLQQLFTAENGLAWPDWADCICSNGESVYFTNGKRFSFIVGSSFGGDVQLLAERQTKEKEVDKQKLVDDFIISQNGIWPNINTVKVIKDLVDYRTDSPTDLTDIKILSFGWVGVDNFRCWAKRLGYINGYRWGVEYPTNGRRPDFPDDLEICAKIDNHHYKNEWSEVPRSAVVNAWGVQMEAFKITDQRYKPADTSYLNALTPEPTLTHSEESLTHKDGDLSDLSIAISDAMNVAVEVGEIETAKRLQQINKDVLQLNATRKAELERKALIQRAVEVVNKKGVNTSVDTAFSLYAAVELLVDGGWRPTK